MNVHTRVPSTGLRKGVPVVVFQLARILERKGWSPYRLAKESGIPQPTVYRLLSEREDVDIRISLRMLDTLCETLGCTVGELLEHEPTPKSKPKRRK